MRIFTMCGIVGVISKAPVNQLIYDALLLLQHRGQDAAGIVTMQGTKCFMHKARGMVRDVFRTRNMRGCRAWWAWARCATRPPATPTAKKRRSPSTSTRPSASCWCTTAT
jgi:glutamine phosphoribosylpyrophosphate amidotransferase